MCEGQEGVAQQLLVRFAGDGCGDNRSECDGMRRSGDVVQASCKLHQKDIGTTIQGRA